MEKVNGGESLCPLKIGGQEATAEAESVVWPSAPLRFLRFNSKCDALLRQFSQLGVCSSSASA